MDLDGLRDKAENLAKEHDDQIDKAIDKVEDLVKGKVDGHDSQIEQAADKLRSFLPDGDKK